MLKTICELIVKAETTGDKIARTMLIVGIAGVVQVAIMMWQM